MSNPKEETNAKNSAGAAGQHAASDSAILPEQVANKIWHPNQGDGALGVTRNVGNPAPTPAVSKAKIKEPKSDWESEVDRAIFGDSTGHPEHGSAAYFQAAESYALFGNHFHDFPSDISQFLGPVSKGGAGAGSKPMSQPPGFERSSETASGGAQGALFERGATAKKSASDSAVKQAVSNLSTGNQQKRQVAGAEQASTSSVAVAGAGNNSVTDLAQLYQHLLSRKLRQNQAQPKACAAASFFAVSTQSKEQQLLLLQQHLQAALDLQQRVHVRQLQLQQHQQTLQLQSQLPRVPRPIFGAGGGGASNSSNNGPAAAGAAGPAENPPTTSGGGTEKSSANQQNEGQN